MALDEYLAFLAVAVALAITPGPDTLLSLRYAVVRRRSGIASATGSSAAILAWAALVAMGAASVLLASETAYRVLCVLGATYLVVLGVRTLPVRWRRRASIALDDPGARTHVRPSSGSTSRSAFRHGVLTSITNPKTGLFFLAVLPAFMPTGAEPLVMTLVLGGTVATVVYAYLLCLVLVADAASRWLARPHVARAIEWISGAILVGLGIATLASAVLPARE